MPKRVAASGRSEAAARRLVPSAAGRRSGPVRPGSTTLEVVHRPGPGVGKDLWVLRDFDRATRRPQDKGDNRPRCVTPAGSA
jgi:hypothetical protein